MANKIPTLDWGSANIAESFRLFKQRIELYFTVKSTADNEKVSTILLATGEEGLRRYNCWSLTAVERTDPEVIFSRFIEQLEPPENFRICRLKFSKYYQKPEETLDTFVNRCKQLADKCDFKEDELNERVVELIIASTPMTDFQKDLLCKPKGLKLHEALALGRNHEASAMHVQQLHRMHPDSQATPVDDIRHRETTCKNCG